MAEDRIEGIKKRIKRLPFEEHCERDLNSQLEEDFLSVPANILSMRNNGVPWLVLGEDSSIKGIKLEEHQKEREKTKQTSFSKIARRSLPAALSQTRFK